MFELCVGNNGFTKFQIGNASFETFFFAYSSNQAAWLLKAVACMDLTTLGGDDTASNVRRLCYKAKYPIREDLLKALDMQGKGHVASSTTKFDVNLHVYDTDYSR